MISTGVIPEAIPVRWDDSRSSYDESLPYTKPEDLLRARQRIRECVVEYGLDKIMQETKAGCAACGGCGGLVVNSIKNENSQLPIIH
jgi:hypothetical protein